MFNDYANKSFEASDRAIGLAMKQGYKMYQLANIVGRHKEYIYMVNYKFYGMSIGVLIKCSNLLKINLDYLLTGEGKDKPYEELKFSLSSMIKAGKHSKHSSSREVMRLIRNLEKQTYKDMPVRKFLCYMDKYKMSASEILNWEKIHNG